LKAKMVFQPFHGCFENTQKMRRGPVILSVKKSVS
jgi:hypothetical protein